MRHSVRPSVPDTLLERAFQHFLARAQRMLPGRSDWSVRALFSRSILDGRMPFERIRTARDRLVDASQAFHELAVESASTLIEGASELRYMLIEGSVDETTVVMELLLKQARTQVEIHDCVVGRALKALTEGHAFFFQRR